MLLKRGTDKKRALEHFLRAESLSKEGLLDDAVKEYKQGLEIFPNYIAAHNNLGNIFLAKGMVEEAIKEYEEALRIDPNVANVHLCLGNALYKKGMLEKSVSEYKKASKIDPNNVVAHINLGSLFAMEGMMNNAISEYEKALKIDPNNTIARSGLEHALDEKKTDKYKIQKLPKDIERECEKLLCKKKGIKLDIISVRDSPTQSIILLKPDKNPSLSYKEQITLSSYIKATLLCEMPRAISSLNNKDLALIRTTTALITAVDGKQFQQPGWVVKWKGYTIGPLSFMMDWDEYEQLFLAGLYEIASKVQRVVSKEYQHQEFSVIRQIARAYHDEIESIEI
jgi:Tfp pilus assembly protein PilF